jgi:hypothetical protein
VFHQAARLLRFHFRRQIHLFLLLISSSLSLSFYSFRIAPSIYWSDVAEFQRVVFTLDIPHPTGYPLYILLGHIWITLFPFGDVAWKMNFLSAVFAAGTVGLVSVIAFKLTGRMGVALMAAALLTVSPSFWSQAVITEVYSFHTLLIGLSMLALLYFREKRSSGSLLLFSLSFGLGLAHHRMFVLLVPGLLLLVLWKFLVAERHTVSLAVVLQGILAIGAGWLPYLLTYTQGDWHSYSHFLQYVFERGDGWFSIEDSLTYFVSAIWPLLTQQLGSFGIVLGVAGFLYRWQISTRDDRGLLLLLGTSWLLAILFFIVYRVPDIYAFIPHFQVLSVLLICLGLQAILSQFDRLGLHLSLIGATALCLVLSGLVFRQGAELLRPGDHAAEWYVYNRSKALLASLPSNAILFANWSLAQPMRYLQDVELIRQDVKIVIDSLYSQEVLQPYTAEGRPIYLLDNGSPVAELPGYQVISAESSVYEEGLLHLLDRSVFQTATTYEKRVEHVLSENLLLESYAITPWPLVVDQLAQLQLCWSGERHLLSQRLLTIKVDPENEWLTWRYRFGPSLADSDCSTHYFLVPPAPYHNPADLQIQLFEDGASTPEHVIRLETLPIMIRSDALAPARVQAGYLVQSNVVIGDARPIGTTVASTTSPGISFPVTAMWQITGDASSLPEIRVQLRNPSGIIVDEKQIALLPDDLVHQLQTERHLSSLPAYVSSKFWLSVPRTVKPGGYSMWLQHAETMEFVEIGAIEVEDFPRLWVQPHIEHVVDANFADGHIQLVGYNTNVSPEELQVNLVWKSVKAVEKNWKVFVHIVDPAGALLAQRDGFPGSGLRWTDTWQSGEYIVDNYLISLPGELEGRPVRIMIGMYDPDTGERLLIRAPLKTSPLFDVLQLAEVVIPGK